MTGINSDRILARMMTLHPKVIDLTLDRMLPLLAKLDHPEQRLPPVIHVAGTNGKGSLLANLRAMLEAAGYRVHVYTSPHLVRFAERIRLAGKIIEEDSLSDLLLDCEKANGDTPITYFEITTIAAFKAFTETPGKIPLPLRSCRKPQKSLALNLIYMTGNGLAAEPLMAGSIGAQVARAALPLPRFMACTRLRMPQRPWPASTSLADLRSQTPPLRKGCKPSNGPRECNG